jgi:hypothetical protein
MTADNEKECLELRVDEAQEKIPLTPGEVYLRLSQVPAT